MISLILGLMMLTIGIIGLGICIFIVTVLLGVWAGILLKLIRRKEKFVKDYRSEEEKEKNYSIRTVVVDLLRRPKQMIQSGEIISYNWVKALIFTFGIIIGMSFILTVVQNKMSSLVVKAIIVWFAAWIGIVCTMIIRWFFTKLNILAFLYVGQVKLTRQEGNRIFNMVFIGLYMIKSVLDFISFCFPKYLVIECKMPYQNHFRMTLGMMSFIWLWYIEYLLLTKRYQLDSKESILKVCLMTIMKVVFLGSMLGSMVLCIKGIGLFAE